MPASIPLLSPRFFQNREGHFWKFCLGGGSPSRCAMRRAAEVLACIDADALAPQSAELAREIGVAEIAGDRWQAVTVLPPGPFSH